MLFQNLLELQDFKHYGYRQGAAIWRRGGLEVEVYPDLTWTLHDLTYNHSDSGIGDAQLLGLINYLDRSTARTGVTSHWCLLLLSVWFIMGHTRKSSVINRRITPYIYTTYGMLLGYIS